MKRMNLSNGMICLVDDEDFDSLNQFSWHYGGRGYVTGAKVLGDTKTIYMHRVIMGNPNFQVDHINGNKLDNRRTNLRLCSNKQNQQNIGKRKNNTSGYKGVSWHSRDLIYEVNIRIDGKLKYLGRNQDLEYCAKLYDKAAKKYFGEFARLNFE